MHEHKDYVTSLNKARKKRNQKMDPRYLLVLLAVIAAAGIIALAVKNFKKPVSGRAGGGPSGQEQGTPSEAEPAEADAEADTEAQVAEALSHFTNLGLIQVSGYVNIRETPGTDGTILGTIANGGGCEVLGTEGDWTKIRSGGIEGYVNS